VSVLESHHFHHQMWVFCMNLFDKRRILRRIAFDESDDEGNEGYQVPGYATGGAQGRSTRTGTFSSNGRSTAASVRTAEGMSESGIEDKDD